MTPEKQMDTIDFIITVESGEFDPENPSHIKSLQEMINSGLIYKLQGSWQRFAQSMIDVGLVFPPKG